MTALAQRTDTQPQLAQVDQGAILRHLNLNPSDPAAQALILVCDRYGLDPILKHALLIKGRLYVTRDGLLHVAHRSNVFDGMEVVEQGETATHHTAKVSVWRKDMGRPFTYIGRYPKSGQIAKDYGPEMAVKVAEVMALRRAFDVALGAAEERWDDAEVSAEVAPESSSDVDMGPHIARVLDMYTRVTTKAGVPQDEASEVLATHRYQLHASEADLAYEKLKRLGKEYAARRQPDATDTTATPLITEPQRKALMGHMNRLGYGAEGDSEKRARFYAWMNPAVEKPTRTKELSEEQAAFLIDTLSGMDASDLEQARREFEGGKA